MDSDGVWISEYERAVDTMLAGDLDGLRALLDDGPDLTVQVSHWPHRATLLHDAGVTAGVAAVLRAAGAR